MFSQTAAVRLSIWLGLVVKRVALVRPSVSRILTFSTSGRSTCPCLNGSVGLSACQPHIMPIVTLVMPAGFMVSTLDSSAVQSVVSGRLFVRPPLSGSWHRAPPASGARRIPASVVDRGRHGLEDRNDGEREDQRHVAAAVGAKRARRGSRPGAQAARER